MHNLNSKWYPWLHYVSVVGMLLCLCVCGYILLSFDLVEARECAGADASCAMRQGVFGMLPYHIYVYGAIQPLLLSLVPETVDEIMLHRCYSFCCCIGSALLIFPIIKRLSHLAGLESPRYLAITICAIFLCPNLENMPFALATPSMQGMFITHLILFLSLCSFRWKPFILGLLVFAAWETKPYFVFSALYVLFAYLFFESNKIVILKHLTIFSLTALLSFMASYLHPQSQTMLQHCILCSGGASLTRAVLKFGYFCLLLAPILVCVPYLVLRYERHAIRSRFHLPLTAVNRTLLFVMINAVIYTLLLLKMGGHGGMIHTIYFAQLLAMPYCLLFAVLWMVYRCEMQRFICLIPVLLLISEGVIGYWFYKSVRRINVSVPLEETVASDIAAAKKICHSALTAPYEYRYSGSISDNGQLRYVHLTYPNKGNHLKQNKERVNAFSEQFRKDVLEGKWDVIYWDHISYIGYFSDADLERHYRKDAAFDAGLPLYEAEVVRWVKKD